MADDRTLSADPWPLSPDRWIEPSARNLAEFFVGTAARGGLRTARWTDAEGVDSGLPEAETNGVALLAPLTAEAAPGLTARLDTFYGATAGAPWIVWSAWPTPDLAPLGYSLVGEPPLMVRPPGHESVPVPAELRIEEATDDETLAAFERTFVHGYPMPALQPEGVGRFFRAAALGGALRFWLGFRDGQPVTVADSCESDGVVGIYAVATLPEARGRGYGAAITDWAARVNPAMPVVLQASDLGRPVYERLGFQTVSHYTLWLRSRKPYASAGR